MERQSPSPQHPSSQSRKRARSISASASDSISTISTNLSISPKRPRRGGDEPMMSQREDLNFQSSRDRKRRHRPSSSLSYSSSNRSLPRKERDDHRRRRRRTISPESRGRPNSQRGSRRSRSHSESIDKSRIARERRSMTPHIIDQEPRRSDHIDSRMDRHGFDRGGKGDTSTHSGNAQQFAPSRPVRKERSLSPYSRRLALTQSMNMVR